MHIISPHEDLASSTSYARRLNSAFHYFKDIETDKITPDNFNLLTGAVGIVNIGRLNHKIIHSLESLYSDISKQNLRPSSPTPIYNLQTFIDQTHHLMRFNSKTNSLFEPLVDLTWNQVQFIIYALLSFTQAEDKTNQIKYPEIDKILSQIRNDEYDEIAKNIHYIPKLQYRVDLYSDLKTSDDFCDIYGNAVCFNLDKIDDIKSILDQKYYIDLKNQTMADNGLVYLDEYIQRVSFN